MERIEQKIKQNLTSTKEKMKKRKEFFAVRTGSKREAIKRAKDFENRFTKNTFGGVISANKEGTGYKVKYYSERKK